MPSLKALKEVEYSNPHFSIIINPINANYQIEFSYTCEFCSGRGSRCENCSEGRKFQYYTSLKALEKDLGKDNVATLLAILQKVVDD